MRRILLATAALAFSAGAAMAADTANVAIDALQAPLCDITSISSNISLSGVNVPVAGVLQYTCNFIGNPTFIFTSANGGVYTPSNGGATVNYGIYVNDVAPASLPSTWLQASTALAPQIYPGISFSSPANATISPFFSVGLSAPLPVAGTYTDTLTVDIAP